MGATCQENISNYENASLAFMSVSRSISWPRRSWRTESLAWRKKLFALCGADILFRTTHTLYSANSRSRLYWLLALCIHRSVSSLESKKKKKKTRRRRKEEQRQKEKKPKIINDKNVDNSMIACIWPVDLLLYNRPVKHRQFVVDFAGSRVGGRKTNPQLVLVLQWWIHIVFGLNHVQQKWLK